MRFGYSENIPLEKIIGVCKLVENKLSKWSVNQSNFYSKVLLSLGFKLKDFQIGKDLIFFRTNKIRLLENLFCDNGPISNSKEQLPIPKQAHRPIPKQVTQKLSANHIVFLTIFFILYRSFSDNPLDRIEGFFLRSKLRSVWHAFIFLSKCYNKNHF